MGSCATSTLAYGYRLGGGACAWEIAEADEYGDWQPAWLPTFEEDDEPNMVEEMMKRLLWASGFTETDWQVDGYYSRRAEAEKRLGLEMIAHGSDGSESYVLAAHHIQTTWGDAQEIPIANLEDTRVFSDWDAKLQSALDILGIHPSQAKPEWLLLAFYG